MAEDYLHDKSGDPPADVARLESVLGELRHRPRRFRAPRRTRALVAAAAGLVALVAASWLVARGPAGPTLGVTLSSADGANPVRRSLAEGGVLETGPGQIAEVTLQHIGSVRVEPGSRLTLAHVRSDEQRLSLHRGAIHARVLAPPRLFVVDTPAATAVDLGCEYRLEVQGDGTSVLRVYSGFVAVELAGGGAVRVPAGHLSEARPGLPPGLPFADDAPEAVRAQVRKLQAGGGADLDALLAAARQEDAFTLWHLWVWPRLPAERRPAVYRRLQQLAPASEVHWDGRAAPTDQESEAYWAALVDRLL